MNRSEMNDALADICGGSKPAALPVVISDGGRRAAGFKGETGDCGCRAMALALGIPYREAYDAINAVAKTEKAPCRSGRRSDARTGVFRKTLTNVLDGYGWEWVPLNKFGQKVKHHLCVGEVPMDEPIIARVSRHFVAVIDGVIHDAFDPSRNGTRMVYGYWRKRR